MKKVKRVRHQIVIDLGSGALGKHFKELIDKQVRHMNQDISTWIRFVIYNSLNDTGKLVTTVKQQIELKVS